MTEQGVRLTNDFIYMLFYDELLKHDEDAKSCICVRASDDSKSTVAVFSNGYFPTDSFWKAWKMKYDQYDPLVIVDIQLHLSAAIGYRVNSILAMIDGHVFDDHTILANILIENNPTHDEILTFFSNYCNGGDNGVIWKNGEPVAILPTNSIENFIHVLRSHRDGSIWTQEFGCSKQDFQSLCHQFHDQKNVVDAAIMQLANLGYSIPRSLQCKSPTTKWAQAPMTKFLLQCCVNENGPCDARIYINTLIGQLKLDGII